MDLSWLEVVEIFMCEFGCEVFVEWIMDDDMW